MAIFASRIMQLQTGTPLSDLAVGTSVYINENGAPAEYLIVNQGIPENSSLYDASCDGTWVLRKDLYSNHEWRGNPDYGTSSINNYLNSTVLHCFDSNVISTVKQVKIPYWEGQNVIGSLVSGADGLSCKVFLLGAYELGWTGYSWENLIQDGAKLSYFSSGTSTSANNKRIAYLNGSVSQWWLRTINPDQNLQAYDCEKDGTCDAGGSWGGLRGVRPAMIFPFDTTVDDNMLIT